MSDEIKEILDYYRKYMSVKDCIKLSKIEDYITNLQQENDYYFKKNNELSTLNTSLRSERDNYKSRIEKAVEYINKHIRIDDEYPAYMEMLIEERDELLTILQGGKDE